MKIRSIKFLSFFHCYTDSCILLKPSTKCLSINVINLILHASLTILDGVTLIRPLDIFMLSFLSVTVSKNRYRLDHLYFAFLSSKNDGMSKTYSMHSSSMEASLRSWGWTEKTSLQGPSMYLDGRLNLLAK